MTMVLINQLVVFADRTPALIAAGGGRRAASARRIASLNVSRRKSGIRTRAAPMRAPPSITYGGQRK